MQILASGLVSASSEIVLRVFIFSSSVSLSSFRIARTNIRFLMRESSEFWEFSPSYLQRQLIICGSLFSGGWFRRGQHGRLCWPPERMSLSDYIRPVLSLLRSSSLACFTVETSRGRPCCFVFTTENQRCLSAEFLLNDVRRGRGCGPHVARRESDCEHVEKIYRKLEKEKKKGESGICP